MAALPDLELRTYERLAPLSFGGTIKIDALEPGSAVVAFSRKAVLALAREIGRRRRVGVLYGNMPPAERRLVAARFAAGEIEVLCATDVLGHGVNLPIRTIVFAETDKWNGSAKVTLAPWEVAQIAGRAGRFGIHEAGTVAVLSGHGWAAPNARVIQDGMVPTAPITAELAGFRRIERAKLGPELADLGDLPPPRWREALVAWDAAARKTIASESSWIEIADSVPFIGRLGAIDKTVLATLTPADAWAFARAPIDHDRNAAIISTLAAAVAGERNLQDLVRIRAWASATEAEAAADQAAILRWFTRRFPGAGKITAADADALEAAAAAAVGKRLPGEIKTNSYGRCANCGKPTLPAFTYCDRCFHGDY